MPQDALYINVNLTPGGQADNRADTSAEDKSVYLRGFSDQLLRFVAERGNAGLLTYVDNIDKTYELGVSVVGQMSARRQQQLLSNIYPSMDALRADRFLTVRPVRIFISSTFHDMHGERDELVRSVFPRLQRELSKKTNGTLKICPIDLRWGVSVDHVSNQSALEQCLIEVTKCDLFVGVFGARYGWIPSKEQLLHAIKRNPLLSWLDDPKILASELSVTALEVMTFLKQFGSERALFFLRQADYSRIAEDKRSFFIESTDGMQRVAKLKKYISDSAPQHVHNYRTTGWIHSKGRTVCSGLEEFSNAVATQLLNACQPFVSRCLESKAINENDFVRNWRTVEEKAGCFTSAAVLGHVQSLLNKPSNKLVVLAGESGCGKTSLAADVAIAERNRQRSAVIPFLAFTKSLSSVQVTDYLTSVIDKIAIELTIEPRSNIAETMADIAKIGGRMVFVFDGLDTCQSLNSIIADFFDIANVTIVMTTSLNSAVCQLATKLGCTLVQIPGLPLAARKTMVRKELAEFGKRLGESAFDSQIRSFVSKRHADKPTYIKLACHYLRLFAYFDNIGMMITKLPSTIESLVREIVKQLELNCGKDLVGSLLGYLLVSPSRKCLFILLCCKSTI
uniref:NACHT domain-containing protein n=1 Tax=Plectus sambesii TaxID=2011161 RepID=A0A914VPP1_9BILA